MAGTLQVRGRGGVGRRREGKEGRGRGELPSVAAFAFFRFRCSCYCFCVVVYYHVLFCLGELKRIWHIFSVKGTQKERCEVCRYIAID